MTKPKTILALDLGTKCGWAIGDGVTAPRFGTWKLTPKRADGNVTRWVVFRRRLAEIMLAQEARLLGVVYEKVRAHRGSDAAHCYGGFEAYLQTFCSDWDIPLSFVEVKTVKKRAGNGGFGKPEMMAAANAKWCIEVGDDNQADALWILDLALTRGA